MKIAVYCSSKDSIPEDILRLGDELGQWIAQQGHTLVYGGATGGLMTRVSNAVKQAQGYVIGIIPTRIVQSHRKADNCDELYLTESMCDRKKMMRQMADCFIVMPGSYGTLDEMMDVVAAGTVFEHNKPLFLLNYKGFYDDLMQQTAKMKQLGFLPEKEVYAPIVVKTLAQTEEMITNWKINTL